MSGEYAVPLPRGWLPRIKSAQRALIERAGGIKCSAEFTGLSTGQMGNFNNRDHPAVMTLPVVAVLEAEAGVPFVTAAMAELNGHRLAAPGSDGGDKAKLTADVFRCNNAIMSKVGALTMAVADALADGQLTPNELSFISRQTAPVRELLASLDMALARGAADGGQVVAFKAGEP
ncbi:hypothetical protein PZ897_02175 [Hoeflea sp. YIM 152468]|uniref:hypothetical protein n=1 Tax=Hoeflea sp. YIM 152468 TaxID=3031759 RepID=UPI0023DA2F68|nr:hypothetical protein [Hoeflea sp. YIM 152468]MDF1606978.1 hypothetical protein [Hoeflea sp. YIM 152468]